MNQEFKGALQIYGINESDIVRKEGKYYLSAEQIGIGLGYADPKHSVLKWTRGAL